METTKQTVIDRLIEHIQSECTPVDTDKRYDEMLDECYDFKAVGGPFAYMSPSRVLAEVDPVAYRCGKNDWVDGERFLEVGDSEYEERDVEKARESFQEDLESKESDLSIEIEEMESDEDHNLQELASLKRQLQEVEDEIKAVQKYVF